jgi:hypothetical protein
MREVNKLILEKQIELLQHLKDGGKLIAIKKGSILERKISECEYLDFVNYEYKICLKELNYNNSSFLLACHVKHIEKNLRLLVTGLDKECVYCGMHKFTYEFFQTKFTFLDGSSIMPR